jgi:nicotinamidase-related amidase
MGGLVPALVLYGPAAAAPAEEPAPAAEVPLRPAVPGMLELHARSRSADDGAVHEEVLSWQVAETAIVVCDMWDDHWCRAAAERVGVLAPRMNHVLSAARDLGVQIIHAPSNTMNHYKDTPWRRRLKWAPTAAPPVPIEARCPRDPAREPPLPIDDSDGGCDDPSPEASHEAWTCQHPALSITGYDGISDSGQEIFSFCRQLGIKNMVVMGVHANMCVLGRSFGIRQMTRLGMNVVLVRDLTDALYDPRDPPYVSHARGTELVVEHIERYWCPSILSSDLGQAIPGTAGPASGEGE